MESAKKSSFFLLCFGALGVVYGDIGTSPLYALRECFIGEHSIPLTESHLLGVLSMIFWSLTIIISIKYILFILRADNHGEGGILALMALALDKKYKMAGTRLLILTSLGIFGACLLYADGMITPAISVLSAIEGLKVVTPTFQPFVIPITCGILVGLFMVQRVGTGRIGTVFGPIMLTWYVVIGILGLSKALEYPEVFRSVNPWYALQFAVNDPRIAWLTLGSVFLVVTGGEALYADIGHFGKRPIRWTWFTVVLPGLMLNYFGQGALFLEKGSSVINPFFELAPNWAVLPLVILAASSTVIASQALISGVFSLTRQAVQLGYFPRVQIVHTSENEIGQIYVPLMNWFLLFSTLFLVVEFKSSSALASAYGIAVSTTMVITTLLAMIVAIRVWKWKKWVVFLLIMPLLGVDLLFLGANLMKVASGGWLPLVVGLGAFVLMSTWRRGREILSARLIEKSQPFEDFLQNIEGQKPVRVPGTAIFMTSDPNGTPAALIHNVRHNKVLHERVLILTVHSQPIPTVSMQERMKLERVRDDIFRVRVFYGFKETPNILKVLLFLEAAGVSIPIEDATFFVGRETLIPSAKPGMAIWRERLFEFMSKNAQRATQFFRIPPENVIEVGIQVEI